MKKVLIALFLILMFAIPQARGDMVVYGGFIPTISSSTNNGLLCWSGTYGDTVKDCSGTPSFDASGNLVTSGIRVTGATATRGAYFNSDKVLTPAAAQTADYLEKWSTTGAVDSSFNQDASNNLIVPGIRNTGLNASAPVETNADKVLSSGTKSGTGSGYVMSVSPTITGTTTLADVSITGKITDASLNASTPIETDASKNFVSGTKTGTGSAYVMDTSPTITNPVLVNPALGTPASGVLTNATGTAAGLTAGNVTTNANMTGPITGTGNVTSITSQTGVGTKFVVDTSPTIKGLIFDTSANFASIDVSPNTLWGSGYSGTGAIARVGSPTFTGAPNIAAATGTSVSVTGDVSGDRVITNAIKFPPVQVASGDANTLDDYEEGTWTPTYSGSTGDASAASSTSAGTYTKIGNLVKVVGYITLTNNGDWTGNVLIGGLPFAASGASIVGFISASNVTYDGQLTTRTLDATATMYIWVSKTAAAVAQLNCSGVPDNGEFEFTALYKF